jgi:8-oxo-dGTP diphosphatase
VLSTLVYAMREEKVLLMLRRKDPNLGLWTAPGGKLVQGENPQACALRELREETGLDCQDAVLRGIITELSPLEHYQWIMFVYVAPRATGKAASAHREGDLAWVAVGQVIRLPIPQADAIFFPRIIDLAGPVYEARYTYDGQLKLVCAEEYGAGRE